jgi:hypothetical protein
MASFGGPGRDVIDGPNTPSWDDGMENTTEETMR